MTTPGGSGLFDTTDSVQTAQPGGGSGLFDTPAPTAAPVAKPSDVGEINDIEAKRRDLAEQQQLVETFTQMRNATKDPARRARLDRLIENNSDPLTYNRVTEDRIMGSNFVRGALTSIVRAPSDAIDVATILAKQPIRLIKTGASALGAEPVVDATKAIESGLSAVGERAQYFGEGINATFDAQGKSGTAGKVAGIFGPGVIGALGKGNVVTKFTKPFFTPFELVNSAGLRAIKLVPKVGPAVAAVIARGAQPGATYMQRLWAGVAASSAVDAAQVVDIISDSEQNPFAAGLTPEERARRNAAAMTKLGMTVGMSASAHILHSALPGPKPGMTTKQRMENIDAQERMQSLAERMSRQELLAEEAAHWDKPDIDDTYENVDDIIAGVRQTSEAQRVANEEARTVQAELFGPNEVVNPFTGAGRPEMVVDEDGNWVSTGRTVEAPQQLVLTDNPLYTQRNQRPFVPPLDAINRAPVDPVTDQISMFGAEDVGIPFSDSKVPGPDGKPIEDRNQLTLGLLAPKPPETEGGSGAPRTPTAPPSTPPDAQAPPTNAPPRPVDATAVSQSTPPVDRAANGVGQTELIPDTPEQVDAASEPAPTYSDSDLNLLRKLAEENPDVGDAINSIIDKTLETHAELRRARRDANTDELTGLGSIKLFYRRVKRGLKPGEVIGMIDMRNLKYWNDNHGREAGDEYMREAATILNGARTGRTDVSAYRGQGGDEIFLVGPADAIKEVHGNMDALMQQSRPPRDDYMFGPRLGIGADPAEADIAMNAEKAREAGKRYRPMKAGNEPPEVKVKPKKPKAEPKPKVAKAPKTSELSLVPGVTRESLLKGGVDGLDAIYAKLDKALANGGDSAEYQQNIARLSQLRNELGLLVDSSYMQKFIEANKNNKIIDESPDPESAPDEAAIQRVVDMDALNKANEEMARLEEQMDAAESQEDIDMVNSDMVRVQNEIDAIERRLKVAENKPKERIRSEPRRKTTAERSKIRTRQEPPAQPQPGNALTPASTTNPAPRATGIPDAVRAKSEVRRAVNALFLDGSLTAKNLTDANLAEAARLLDQLRPMFEGDSWDASPFATRKAQVDHELTMRAQARPIVESEVQTEDGGGFVVVNGKRVPKSTGGFVRIGRKKVTAPQEPFVDEILSKVVNEGETRMMSTQNLMSSLEKFQAEFVNGLKIFEVLGRELGTAAERGTANIMNVSRLLLGSAGKADSWLENGSFRLMRNGMVERTGTPGIKDIINSFDDYEVGLFDAYIVAKRAVALDARGIKTPLDIRAARQTVSLVESSHPKIREASTIYNKLLDDSLQYMADSGMYDQATIEKFKEMNQYYASFRKLFNGSSIYGSSMTVGANRGIEAPQPGRSTQGANDPIREIKGGTEGQIVSPMFTIVDELRRRIHAADLNTLNRAIVEAAERNPAFADQLGIRKYFGKSGVEGGEVAEIGRRIQEEAKQAGVELSESEAYSEALRVSDAGLSPASDRLRVFRNGNIEYWDVPPELIRASRMLQPQEIEMFWTMMSKPTKFLEQTIVSTPLFAAVNMFRDTFEASIQSKYGFTFGVDTVRGLIELINKGEAAKLAPATGASLAGRAGAKPRTIEEAITKLRSKGVVDIAKDNPMQALRESTRFFEDATRIGAFMRARKAGASDMQAGVEYRQVTADFAQRGLSMRAATMMTAFMNPAIQSTSANLAAIRDNPGRVLSIGVGAIMIPTLMLWAANKGDKDIEEIRKSEYGGGYWYFRTGEDKILRMPKPFLFGALFGNGAEAILDQIYDKDPAAGDRFIKAIADQLVPPIMPNVPALAFGLIANRQFRGTSATPIAPDALETGNTQVEPRLQYRQGTSEISKGIGDVFNLSPAKLDFLIKGLLGPLGDGALYLGDRVIDPNKSDLRNPITSRFHAQFPTNQSYSMQTLRAEYYKASAVKNTYDAYVKAEDAEKAVAYANEHSLELAKYEYYSDAMKEIYEMQNQVAVVYQSKDLSRDTKMDMIKGIMRQIIDKARLTNEAVQ